MKICDITGSVLIGNQNLFDENMSMHYAFDSVSNTNYTVLRINKTRVDGSKQYAFG